MVAGSILLLPGTAAAAVSVSQAQGRFLGGSAVATNLDNIAALAPAAATNDGTTPKNTSTSPLSATVLNAVTADLGSGVNLFGANGVITLGAVNQYASASDNGSSYSASGAIDNNGAIGVGGVGGVPTSDATVDLGKVLALPGGLGTTVVSAGTLQVGAVSATANQTAAGVQTGTYKIASLKLNLTSPLIANLTSSLKTVDLLGLLNGLSLGGAATFTNVPSLSTILTNVSPVTSADGSIVVNISTGVVSIDIAKVLTAAGLDINNLPQNTELLPYVTTALTTQLLPAITSSVNSLLTQITTAISGIKATVAGIPVLPGVLNPALAVVATTVTSPVSTALAGAGNTVITPLAGLLANLLSLTGNVRSTTGGTFTQTALRLTLVPGATPLAVVRLASASVGPNSPLPTPTAASLTPTHGPVAGNTQVTITGTGFVAGGTSVSIGGNVVAAANVTVTAGGTAATFSTPAHAAGSVPVTATTAGGTTTPALTFTYDPVPTAASISPNQGPTTGNVSTTITGTGFVPNLTSVSIGGNTVAAADVTVAANGNSATFRTPAHAAGPVSVTVTTPGGTTTPALTYTYVTGPTAASLSPTHGPIAGNTVVTVTGTGFQPNATSVTIGGTTIAAADVTVNGGGTTATFTTPAHGAGPVDVTLTTVGGSTTPPLTFTYDPIPTATSINPTRGPIAGGDATTITGTGFVPGLTSVTIGGNTVPAGSVTVGANGTTATFNTPAHAAGPVTVTVATPGGSSTPALAYTYLAVPTAASINPNQGPTTGGDPTIITGTGFVAGATSVSIGGNTVAAANVTVNADGTTATFTTPAHAAGAVFVTVTTQGGTTSPALGYTYVVAPTSASLTPTHGPVAGNTPVTVTGTGFQQGGTSVTIGGVTVPAANVTVNGAGTSASFSTPAHSAGSVDVTLTTAGGSTTPPLTFTYDPVPTATAINPSQGPIAGGDITTISGTGFVSGLTSISIGGVTVPAGAVAVTGGGTIATFTTPAHTAGAVQVSVTTPGGTTTPSLTYTYLAIPTATSIDPGHGPVAGNDQVTITGSGFVSGSTSVSIGGNTVPATGVTVNIGGTTASFATPAHAAGAVGVTVTTAGGTTTPALQYTYDPVPTAAAIAPAQGPTTGGITTTITGTGFVPGLTSVSIGGNIVATGDVLVADGGTTASFTTPAHAAGAVQVTVTTPGGTSTPPLSYLYVPAPTATSLTPTHGPAAGSTLVTISGTNFQVGGTSVLIGGNTVAATDVTVNPAGTSATFATPAHAVGVVNVSVRTAGGTSSPPLLYTYDPVPTSTSLTPLHGPVAGNTLVTVTGTGFLAGNTSVLIGGNTVAAGDVTVSADGTTASFLTPAHAKGSVDVTLTTTGGTTTPPLTFTYDPIPTAASLSPDHGPVVGGNKVSITGTGFVAGFTTVTIGGVTVAADSVSGNGTIVVVTAPAHAAGAVDVTVATPGGTTTPALTYSYDPVPTAATLTPSHGPATGKTLVSITGTGFVPNLTAVTIGGVTIPAGQVTVGNNGTTAVFTTPAHAVGAVSVTVSTPGGTSTPALTFTYDPPTASTLTPVRGPVAGSTPVVVNGSGFVPGQTSVTIGGITVAASLVDVITDSQLTFNTPAHAAGPVAVTVITPDGTTTPALGYTYDPVPTAQSIDPDQGPIAGGDLTAITGTGFLPGLTSVSIGGNTLAGSDVTVTGNGTIASFRTPAHEAGLVGVTVTTTGGTSTPPLQYLYLDVPTATSLDPDHGSTAGGDQVTVTGTGFVQGATSVTIGGTTVAAAGVTVNVFGTTATFATPAHAVGLVGVAVTTAGGTTTPALPYTYDPVPTAASLSPTHGPVGGLTSVTISGAGFRPGATSVTIGGNTVAATAVDVNLAGTTATFLTPAHDAGTVDVTVTTSGGTTAPALKFSYDPVPTAASINPGNGPVAGGDPTTITGTGLVPGLTSVTIGGITLVAADVTVNPAGTSASFLTPAHPAGGVGVTVTTPGGTSTPPLSYLYVPVPTATSLDPTHGSVVGGELVTITGSGFLINGTSVSIGGNTVAAGNVSVNLAGTAATFRTPAHPAGSVTVTATTAGGSTTPALTYTYDPVPTAASLTPTRGSVTGGTPVTVTGSGFLVNGTSVSIGGNTVAATDVVVNGTGTSASFLTPPHPQGTVDVTLTTSGGTTTPALRFTYDPVPTALSINPAQGPTIGGVATTITGTGFLAGLTSVLIGGNTVPATAVTVNVAGTAATFTTPAHGAGSVDVTVTTPGGTSTPALRYDYLPVPTTTALIPTHGPAAGNTVVTITGSGFQPGATSVLIGGKTVAAGAVAVNPAGTTASFSTPSHAVGVVNVSVTTPGGTSTPPLLYTYDPVPGAVSLTPTHGPTAGNTLVTVTGTGFIAGSTSVLIGGNTVDAADVTVNGAGTTASFRTPAHPAGPVDVTLTTTGGTTTPPLTFTYDVVPTAASLTPAHGPVGGGTKVTVTGSGFVLGFTTVTIDGTTVAADSVSGGGTTAVFTTVPHPAGPVGVTVTTPGGTTAPALTYTFDGVPTAASLSPNHGPATGGTLVSVTGTGFVPNLTTVTIGGTTIPAGQVTVGNNGTTAVFTTPAHPVGPVSVSVTTPGGTSTPGLPFTYDAPTATGLSPDHGPVTGGTPVAITGSGFVPGQTSVTIGGVVVPASAVDVNSDSELVFSTPSHAAGGVAVTVTTPNGTTAPLGFFYGPLPVTSCILTGGNAGTVTVTAGAGANTGLVPSNFSVTLNGQPVGTPTPVTPLLGGFLVAVQASVPLPDSTTSVSYRLTAVDGSYPAVTGPAIPCVPLTGPQREAGIYHPLQSARLLDTRLSVPVAAGATYTLQVLGRGGVPATKVATLVANVTVTQPEKSGFLTVYPDGSRPNTSSVNFATGQTVANLMTAPVGADGKIRIYNGSTGTTHVLVDVSGYFSSGDTVAPGSYKRLDPARILDTNRAIGVPTSTPVPANGILTVKVTGVGGVQATNVSAVALNLTVDQTQKSGFITVFKSGAVAPQISSLNFQGGQTDANLVIAPVAPDGTIRIKNISTGTVRLIADVSGYFLGGVPILDGEFVAVTPSRILDTRPAGQPVQPLATITPTMAGRNMVPATGVSAVVLNVTVDHPKSTGYITVFPKDPRPTASNLNFVKNQPKPNSVIAPLGADGKVRMFDGSPGSVDLIADVSGYFISNPLG